MDAKAQKQACLIIDNMVQESWPELDVKARMELYIGLAIIELVRAGLPLSLLTYNFFKGFMKRKL